MPHGLLHPRSPGRRRQAAGHLARPAAALRARSSAACGQCASCRRVRRASIRTSHRRGPGSGDRSSARSPWTRCARSGGQLALSSYEGRGTCVVIEPAHALNRNAANALLKTLEEPRPDAHADAADHVARACCRPRVRSRCLRLRRGRARSRSGAGLAGGAAVPHRAPTGRRRWMCWAWRRWRPGQADVPQLLAIRDEVLQVLQGRRPGPHRRACARLSAGPRTTWPCACACIENCLTGPGSGQMPGRECVLPRCKMAVWT